MRYDPDYARRCGMETLYVVVGAALHHWLGWWGIFGCVLTLLFFAVWHEVRYGR